MRHTVSSLAFGPAFSLAYSTVFAACALSVCAGASALASTNDLSATQESVSRAPALASLLGTSDGKWLRGEQEKCWPHAWKGGDPTRFAVAVDSELCLRGKFGEDTPVNEMRTELSALSVGNATIMESDVNLFMVEALAYMPVIGTPTAEARVLALGYEVWSDSIAAPELTFDRDFTLLNFDKAVSAPFKIGPVPATVSAGARARLDTHVHGVLAIANARGTLTPKLASGGYAQVAVDAIIARAGVDGEVELLNDTVRIDGVVGLGVDVSKKPVQVFFAGEAKGTNELSALSGRINLFAETAKDGKFFEKEFFRWEGVKNNNVLFSNVLKPTPVFQASAPQI